MKQEIDAYETNGSSPPGRRAAEQKALLDEADEYIDLSSTGSKYSKGKGYTDRKGVQEIANELVLIQPVGTGCQHTKFDADDECSDYVDIRVWFVTDDGDADPMHEEVRLWGEVLVEKLSDKVDRILAARIFRPGRAYLFDKLNDHEIALTKQARRSL